MVACSTETGKRSRGNHFELEWGLGQLSSAGVVDVVMRWFPLVDYDLAGKANVCVRFVESCNIVHAVIRGRQSSRVLKHEAPIVAPH